MQTITDAYAKLNAQLHESNAYYGTSGARWAQLVRELASYLGTRDILDYGCGKQTLANSLPDLPVRGYDPAIAGMNAPPQSADLVVCTDVLEHVEPELIDNVLDDLQRVTARLGFYTVATRPAKKFLADGRNAHLIQQPIAWWLERLGSRFVVLGYHDYGGQEFLVVVAARTHIQSLKTTPLDMLIELPAGEQGAQTIRVPASLKLGAVPVVSDGNELELARMDRGAGRLEEAELRLRQLIASQPDNADALIELGGVLQDKKRRVPPVMTTPGPVQPSIELFDAGARVELVGLAGASPAPKVLENGELALRERINAKPDDAFAYFELGTFLYQHGRMEEAERALRRATRLNPNFAEAQSNLGHMLAERGNVAEAISCFTRAVEAKPGYVAAWSNLGLMLAQSNRLGEAIDAFNQVLTRQPDHAGAVSGVGLALQHLQRFDEAEAWLIRAVALDSSRRDILVSLSEVYLAKDEPAKAAACLEVACARGEPDIRLLFQLGSVYRKLGREQEAVESFEKAYQLDSAHPGVRKGLAAVYHDAGRDREAVLLLRSVLEQLPNDVETLNLLGAAYTALGLSELAEAAFLQATVFEPGFVDPYINIGKLYEDRGDRATAIEYCDKALAFEPGNYRASFNKGIMLDLMNRSREAIALYERLIAAHPLAQEVHHNLSLLYLRVGDLPRAWDEYQWRNFRYNVEKGFYGWRPETPPLPKDLAQQTVEIIGEQGIGDELFFLRWLPALKARGARVVYWPRTEKLIPLLEQLPAIDEIRPQVDEIPRAGIQYLCGDLPYLLIGDPIGATPPSVRLQVPPALSERLQQDWLSQFPARPFVGITWRAGLIREGRVRNRDKTLEKALPLQDLLQVLAGLNVNFVILQRSPTAEEMAMVSDVLGSNYLDASGLDDDMTALLGLIDQLDDIVGVSNTNLHLRAALGKTASVLIPSPGEFRWMDEGEASPWFPGFGIYRQTADFDWAPALGQLRQDLHRKFLDGEG